MKTKIKTTFSILFSVVIAFAMITIAQSDEPTLRKIPGITDKDANPNGCVSCHKNYPEMKADFRLSKIFTEWAEKVPDAMMAKFQAIAPDGIQLKGKHPYKVKEDDNVPEVCFKCHGKSMKTAFPMQALLHTIHLTGEKNNHFLTMYNGDCTHCHKFDQKSGFMKIVSAKESDQK